MAGTRARAWQLLQSIPEPVVVVDADGIIVLVDARGVGLFGYQPQELIGQPVPRLVAALHAAYSAHLDSSGAVQEHGPQRVVPGGLAAYGDGSAFPVDVDLSATTPARADAALSVIRDISDRLLADAELRISDERFRVSFDSSPVGMAMIDLDPDRAGRFLEVNVALCALTGYTEAQLLATTSPAISHPADRLDTVANLARLGRGGAIRWDTDLRYTTSVGEDVWVHLIVSVVHDADGRRRHGVCQVEDITTRKAAESELTHARREAERANAAKDEFLSRLSHELRTPLNAVLGFAQLLERDTLSPKHVRYVGHILRGGQHLLAMVDDILDVNSTAAGGLDLSPEIVDVGALLRELIGLMQPLAAANQVTVRHHLVGAAATRLHTDPQRLRQVLINLLSNAIKYNRPGGTVEVVVEVIVEGRDDVGAGAVSIAVTDTGPGISPVDLPRLFAAFDRLGRESTDIEGTGIGLNLSRRLVTLMGGRLEVETAAGEGSTFTVTLPGGYATSAIEE